MKSKMSFKQHVHLSLFIIIIIFGVVSFVSCCRSKSYENMHIICDNGNVQMGSICQPKNILTMPKDEQEKFLNSFDVILSDLDGVLWVTSVFPGAGDTLNHFKNIGKKITFVTNNSVRPIDDMNNKFNELKIEVETKDIFHPSRTAVDYLKKINFNGLIYLIGSTFFKKALTDAGFSVIDGPNEILRESYTELAKRVFTKEPVQAVIMDTDFNVCGSKLIKAQIYLQNPECMLMVGATDKLLPVKPTISLIGPGFYSEIVEKVTGKQPIVLGKPGKDLCQVIMDQLDIKDPKRTLMIGDTLDQDVAFGKLCGFQTLVVLTGDAKLGDFEKSENTNRLPDYYANSLAEMNILFENSNKI